MNKTEIGKLIRQARLKREWTLQQLADQIGVTAASISRWENGDKSILGESLIKLAYTLDIVSDLFPGYVRVGDSHLTNQVIIANVQNFELQAIGTKLAKLKLHVKEMELYIQELEGCVKERDSN